MRRYPTKAGTLGMSLQTPRILTDDDLALLAGVTHSSYHPTTIVLTRAAAKAKRSYATARIEVGPTTKSNWSDTLVEEVVELIRAVPGLRTLAIEQRRALEPPAMKRLTNAVKGLKLDTWSIT